VFGIVRHIILLEGALENKEGFSIYETKLTHVSHDCSDFRTKINELAGLSWKYAGLVRSESGLRELLNNCDAEIDWLANQPISSRTYFEYRNMLHVARLVALFAMKREFSIGSHFRTDDLESIHKPLVRYQMSVDEQLIELNANHQG